MLSLGMETTSTAIVVATKAGPLTLDLVRIKQAEARAIEVASVTPTKAPELLATFNQAYLDASNAFSRLRYERDCAEAKVNQIKAEILLDKIPGILKAKGVSSSADVRQAIIELDAGYQEALDNLSQLEAMVEFVKGKMKFLENAFTSVKKIMDTKNWPMEYKGSADERSGFVDEALGVGDRQTSRPMFGNPK